MVFDWLGVVIFFVVFLVLICTLKVSFDFYLIKKKGYMDYALLIEKYNLERNKNHLNTQKVKLLSDFNNSILERLLFITKELISFQNLIFGK
ncbi:hypothetical protein DIS18_08210 [Algibacter marinivivus]|uniref:Uncharacterized protein n=1 Tax=Algibacter marinivivus TaxID=2100723 RepID=A0A2U2X9R7_9FLAO|nr:hypothetical protein [Algibacter marinivivus]PWH84493.1 hypothetical protein DIS18_08210 [Algibacter marinivivus]